MLSDEERKAVDKIKTLIQYLNVWKENFTIVPEDVKYLVTILNLIEKKSKEMEELRNEVMEKELIIDGMKEDRRIAAEEIQEQYFVSKEEAEQKEKKAYIDGTNIADELCNKKWKDKIKAKIEEEDKLFFKTKDVRHANRYKAYKELLEKE